MARLLVWIIFCLGWMAWCPAIQAQEAKRSLADIVADLRKGEKEQLRAVQELEALGEKAAEAVPALIEVLKGKSEDVRLGAALALGKIGPAAVQPLTVALAEPDAEVRFYVVWSLAFIGPRAKSATPVVLKALEDPSAQVRRKAAYALGRIDPDPETVIGGLIGALSDLDEDVRQAARASLPGLGKVAVPPLIRALQNDKGQVRHLAIQTLGEIGPAAETAIPDLKGFLFQGEGKTAELAADALAGIGAPAFATLLAAAGDDNSSVRILALRGVQKTGVAGVPALVDLLGARHVDVRRHAAAMLGSIPVNDKMVIIGLGFATRDKDFQVRSNALQALRNRGPGAKLAEPYITDLLIDIDPAIRVNAFHTLQGLGVDPRPGLKKALSNQDPRVRINTASLMAALNLEVALAEPILLEGLKEKDQALKMQAAYALSQRGLQADEVLPIFIEGLKGEPASVRRQAAEAIARYGTKARKAAPALLATLEDADDSVRAQALATLRGVGAEPRSLLPAMVKVLKRKADPLQATAAQVILQVAPDAVGEIVGLLRTEDAPALRLACLQALAVVGPSAKEAVPELIKALEDPAPHTRLVAVRALGNIGPEARTAQDVLTRALKDADANVQKVAQAALAQIRAEPNKDGFEVQGILTAGDPFDKVRQGCHHVVHIFTLKAGQKYQIDLISNVGPKSWDNYLRLENAQGQQLAQDDDAGGNLNARIFFTPPQTARYRIIVTSFSQKAIGNYTLRVR